MNYGNIYTIKFIISTNDLSSFRLIVFMLLYILDNCPDEDGMESESESNRIESNHRYRKISNVSTGRITGVGVGVGVGWGSSTYI